MWGGGSVTRALAVCHASGPSEFFRIFGILWNFLEICGIFFGIFWNFWGIFGKIPKDNILQKKQNVTLKKKKGFYIISFE